MILWVAGLLAVELRGLGVGPLDLGVGLCCCVFTLCCWFQNLSEWHAACVADVMGHTYCMMYQYSLAGSRIVVQSVPLFNTVYMNKINCYPRTAQCVYIYIIYLPFGPTTVLGVGLKVAEWTLCLCLPVTTCGIMVDDGGSNCWFRCNSLGMFFINHSMKMSYSQVWMFLVINR